MSDKSLKKTVNPRGTHLQIAEAIREDIKHGVYTKRLPTMTDLTHLHDVSRSVIHRALHILKEEGLLEPVQGVGWYVAGRSERRPADAVIREAITKHYQPGDKLSEAALCQLTGHSRLSIRSALARLEGQGIVSPATPRGRTILAISTDKEAS